MFLLLPKLARVDISLKPLGLGCCPGREAKFPMIGIPTFLPLEKPPFKQANKPSNAKSAFPCQTAYQV